VVVRLEPRRFVTRFTDAHLAYALPFFVVVAVTIQFILQMNRMIGANVLGYFVARLGSARYFELLRRFVDDLTEQEARVTAFSVTGAPLTRGTAAARRSRRTRDTA
jgi:hypothetical protein